MFIVLIRRSWLVWGPALVACSIGIAWATRQWVAWEWVPNVAQGLAFVICLAMVLWFIGSIAVFTRRGFALPFAGHGRWRDVVAREESTLTMRVGDSFGFNTTVSLERVENWPALERIFANNLMKPLPGETATEPNPEWLAKLETRADALVAGVSREVAVPSHTREWLRPDKGHPTHHLRLTFAPAGNTRQVTLTLCEADWYPEVMVNGFHALLPARQYDDDDHGVPDDVADDDCDNSLQESVALVAALLGDGRQEPLEAWRLIAGGGGSWDFYPRLAS